MNPSQPAANTTGHTSGPWWFTLRTSGPHDKAAGEFWGTDALGSVVIARVTDVKVKDAAMMVAADDLLAALIGERGLVESAQAILTACLRPDGISEREAITQLLELLGGPLQHEVKAKVEAAIAKATGKVVAG